jgi:hypothetical protein
MAGHNTELSEASYNMITESYQCRLLDILSLPLYKSAPCVRKLKTLINQPETLQMDKDELHEKMRAILSSVSAPPQTFKKKVARLLERKSTEIKRHQQVKALSEALENAIREEQDSSKARIMRAIELISSDNDISNGQVSAEVRVTTATQVSSSPRSPEIFEEKMPISRRVFKLSKRVIRTGTVEKEPLAPVKFILAMNQSVLKYTEESGLSVQLVHKVLIIIIENYIKRYAKYKAETNELAKGYHSMRLLLLMNWIDEAGYHLLLENVKKTMALLKSNEIFDFSENAEDISEKSLMVQEELYWISTFMGTKEASENSDGMIYTLELLSLIDEISRQDPSDEIKQNKISQFMEILNQFKSFFIVTSSVDEINIAGSPRNNFINTVEQRIIVNYQAKDNEGLLNDFPLLKEILHDIYNELKLQVSWMIIGSLVKNIFLADSDDSTKKYMQYFYLAEQKEGLFGKERESSVGETTLSRSRFFSLTTSSTSSSLDNHSERSSNRAEQPRILAF